MPFLIPAHKIARYAEILNKRGIHLCISKDYFGRTGKCKTVTLIN